MKWNKEIKADLDDDLQTIRELELKVKDDSITDEELDRLDSLSDNVRDLLLGNALKMAKASYENIANNLLQFSQIMNEEDYIVEEIVDEMLYAAKDKQIPISQVLEGDEFDYEDLVKSAIAKSLEI